MTQAPAAWYPDPDGSGLRYWDGAVWTEHRAAGPTAIAPKAASAGWGWKIAGVLLILLAIGGFSNAFTRVGDLGNSANVAAFVIDLLLPLVLVVGGLKCITHRAKPNRDV